MNENLEKNKKLNIYYCILAFFNKNMIVYLKEIISIIKSNYP